MAINGAQSLQDHPSASAPWIVKRTFVHVERSMVSGAMRAHSAPPRPGGQDHAITAHNPEYRLSQTQGESDLCSLSGSDTHSCEMLPSMADLQVINTPSHSSDEGFQVRPRDLEMQAPVRGPSSNMPLPLRCAAPVAHDFAHMQLLVPEPQHPFHSVPIYELADDSLLAKHSMYDATSDIDLCGILSTNALRQFSANTSTSSPIALGGSDVAMIDDDSSLEQFFVPCSSDTCWCSFKDLCNMAVRSGVPCAPESPCWHTHCHNLACHPARWAYLKLRHKEYKKRNKARAKHVTACAKLAAACAKRASSSCISEVHGDQMVPARGSVDLNNERGNWEAPHTQRRRQPQRNRLCVLAAALGALGGFASRVWHYSCTQPSFHTWLGSALPELGLKIDATSLSSSPTEGIVVLDEKSLRNANSPSQCQCGQHHILAGHGQAIRFRLNKEHMILHLGFLTHALSQDYEKEAWEAVKNGNNVIAFNADCDQVVYKDNVTDLQLEQRCPQQKLTSIMELGQSFNFFLHSMELVKDSLYKKTERASIETCLPTMPPRLHELV